MSTNMSEMYTETSIQDLPNEMLEQILLFLNFDDRRPALQVCRRWSTLKLWSSVQLVVNCMLNRGQEANYHRTLLASSRQYKHLVLYFGFDTSKYELLVEILQHYSHKVETLKLIPYWFVPIEQMLITQILSMCSNLRHLDIDSGQIDFGSHDLQISPLHKLEELYLGGKLLPNMINITPNITRLHMRYSLQALIFLRHFSSKLVELEFEIYSKDNFLTICEMQFPLLEKLNFYCVDRNICHSGYLKNAEMINLFFHQLPLLKEVILRCNLDGRFISNLCRSCVNIKFLCVSVDSFLQDSFRAICELKHLKRLRIEDATVDVPPDMYSPQTSLRKLTLDSTRILHQVNFNSFIQRAFPNLAVMELSHFFPHIIMDQSLELHRQICRNIPSLQRLVFSEGFSDIMLGSFLKFCASHAPKELRFKCRNISDTSENEIHNRIPVQKLVLVSQQISPSVLKKLISSMEELRWLEIAPTKYCSPEEISSLREQFPRCSVVAKPKVVIEEPLWQS